MIFAALTQGGDFSPQSLHLAHVNVLAGDRQWRLWGEKSPPPGICRKRRETPTYYISSESSWWEESNLWSRYMIHAVLKKLWAVEIQKALFYLLFQDSGSQRCCNGLERLRYILIRQTLLYKTYEVATSHTFTFKIYMSLTANCQKTRKNGVN